MRYSGLGSPNTRLFYLTCLNGVQIDTGVGQPKAKVRKGRGGEQATERERERQTQREKEKQGTKERQKERTERQTERRKEGTRERRNEGRKEEREREIELVGSRHFTGHSNWNPASGHSAVGVEDNKMSIRL